MYITVEISDCPTLSFSSPGVIRLWPMSIQKHEGASISKEIASTVAQTIPSYEDWRGASSTDLS